MGRWFHRIRRGALALSLAATLSNCGGGGGGGGGTDLRLFFGMNGDGGCNSVVVNVDLADADATLARNDNGGVDCVLDPTLAGKGCHATFTELENGDKLRVAIGGCAIPAVTNLFACVFEDVDISDINSESDAQCVCTVPGCDGTPPLCIDADLNPRSCEDCINGRDDDGNGLTDCDDPNCEHSPLCAPTTTTTTTSTLPEATTTTEAVTTTTLSAQPISINFELSAAAKALATLKFTANYTSAPGAFDGIGPSVACSNEVDGAVFTRDNKASIRKLALGWTSNSGIDAPTALSSCQFFPGTPVPVPANFTIVINEATDANGDRVHVNIGVTISGVP